MPNARIKNSVANTGIRASTTPNSRARNTIANTIVRGTPLNVRTSSFQQRIVTPASSTTIAAGTPIGLLLALTYAADVIVTVAAVLSGDQRPNARIR